MVSLLSHQDPKQFLQSSSWGCSTWHHLSSRCRLRLERLHSAESLSSEDLNLLQDQFAESLLDCYVHTRVCYRCKPTTTVACRLGQELVQTRDSAIAEARRLGVESMTLSHGSLDPEQQEILTIRELAERQLLHHMRDCEECSTTRPLGRFSVPVWNIEAARLQRL